MLKCGRFSELRAGGGDPEPPVCVSGAGRDFAGHLPATSQAVPPDPLFLKYLERCHPILHRVITRHEQRQTARFPDGGRAQN